jgi:cytochrome P450
VLRALFSLPDADERDRLARHVRGYVTGPGRPQVFDILAASETSLGFALGGRRVFQKRWFAAVDAIVAARREAPHRGHRDLLDLLLAAGDADTGAPLAAAEVRVCDAQLILATLLHRHTLALTGPRPVLPVARVSLQPDHAPMFELEPI